MDRTNMRRAGFYLVAEISVGDHGMPGQDGWDGECVIWGRKGPSGEQYTGWIEYRYGSNQGRMEWREEVRRYGRAKTLDELEDKLSSAAHDEEIGKPNKIQAAVEEACLRASIYEEPA